jgi:hypothetical protein
MAMETTRTLPTWTLISTLGKKRTKTAKCLSKRKLPVRFGLGAWSVFGIKLQLCFDANITFTIALCMAFIVIFQFHAHWPFSVCRRLGKATRIALSSLTCWRAHSPCLAAVLEFFGQTCKASAFPWPMVRPARSRSASTIPSKLGSTCSTFSACGAFAA